MCSRLARQAASTFLVDLFGGWLKQLEHMEESGLFEAADQFVAIVSADEAIAKMPSDIREMACVIARLSDTYLPPDRKWPLVGGLIVLRLYCPALTAPTTHGLLPADYPVSAEFRRIMVSITRLVQSACNHQLFKEGPQMALNEWIEKNMVSMDRYLEKVVESAPLRGSSSSSLSSSSSSHSLNTTSHPAELLQMVQLISQHASRLSPPNAEFEKLLNACGPIPLSELQQQQQQQQQQLQQSSSTSPAPVAAKGAVLVQLLEKQRKEKLDFDQAVERHAWPCAWIKEYLGSQVLATEQLRRCATLAQFLANDKYGVTCTPKQGGGKVGNHVVFLAREGVDWLCTHLKLPQRGHGLSLLQAMADANIVLPWKGERQVRVEDNDRPFWFDYKLLQQYAKAQDLAEEAAWKRAVAAPYQLAHIGGLVGVAGAPHIPERDQWIMLLGISLAMLDVKFGISPRDGWSRDEFSQWCRSYLGFTTSEQAQSLLESFLGDGFVSGGAGALFVFNEGKIRTWQERKGSSLRGGSVGGGGGGTSKGHVNPQHLVQKASSGNRLESSSEDVSDSTTTGNVDTAPRGGLMDKLRAPVSSWIPKSPKSPRGSGSK